MDKERVEELTAELGDAVFGGPLFQRPEGSTGKAMSDKPVDWERVEEICPEAAAKYKDYGGSERLFIPKADLEAICRKLLELDRLYAEACEYAAPPIGDSDGEGDAR